MGLTSCGQNLPKMNIEQDNYMTGGVSFLYDKDLQTAFFGGENEVIAYYERDIAKGFLQEGNRVGLKFIPSSNIEDIGALTFKIRKEEIKGESVVTKIHDKIAYFQLFPLIKKSGEKLSITVEYKGKKDMYYVQIHKKSILMEKNEEISLNNLT